jgi:hypothetical protein
MKSSSVECKLDQLSEIPLTFVCTGLDCTDDGNLVLVEGNTSNVYLYSQAGSQISKLGVCDTRAEHKVWDIVMSCGDLYVPEFTSGNVYVYKPDGTHVRTIQTGVVGIFGISILDDTLIIPSSRDNCVYSLPLAHTKQKTVLLKHEDMKGLWYIATTPGGTVVVTCNVKGSNNIVGFGVEGKHLFTHAGHPAGDAATQVHGPWGVAVYKNQYVIVADTKNKRLVILSLGGLVCGHVTLPGCPMAVAVDKAGHVIVSVENPNKVITLQLAFTDK